MNNTRDEIELSDHIAGSGALGSLVETAKDYAHNAASENTLKAYTADWTYLPVGVG